LHARALDLGLEGERRRRAVIQMAMVDTGRERDAVSVALTALAPHLPRYQRSLANYARELSDHEA
jgi:hypothetical protein